MTEATEAESESEESFDGSFKMAEGRHVFRSKSRVKGLEMSFVIG